MSFLQHALDLSRVPRDSRAPADWEPWRVLALHADGIVAAPADARVQ